ncbi:portal protein [Vibrio phage douglas 12A4]|uniref:portal protein n=1 Tax=Vibrio phage douglas 12A4 TaxID=573171 RepID=UPI0002C08F51|nr:portal protein [Vibrio phage douglas 12A4]AGG58045.1 portal protein [Vibrio phage douglas 12A4]
MPSVAMVNDEAKPDQGFSLNQLLSLIGSIDSMPDWRQPAQVCCDYYDGDQISAEVKNILNERGQPVIVNNLIAPVIDAILGMEARTRTDLMLSADDNEGDQLRDALQEKFSDAWRLSRGDRANADAYASQIKSGVGWVEVVRNTDEFSGGPYKIRSVRRQEVWWDWNSEEPDCSDARWILRKRWIDIDDAKANFPDHAEVIQNSINQWADFADLDAYEEMDTGLQSAFHDYNSWDRKESEWLNSKRKRVLMQTVYYKTWRRGYVLDLPSGRTVEFNPNNVAHCVALNTGRATKRIATWGKIREAWFVGPHRIVDRPCSAPDGYYPLVPFFGYRKDSSGEPYGVVSRMISAQDEINVRRMKLTWLLQAKRIIADADATNMSRQRLVEEAEKPDGYIELNPDRRNKKSISETLQIQQDFNVASQQFQVMQDAMKQIQDCAGVYNSMLGQDSSATSGVAINSLVEQGATTLAEINDNFHYSRTRVADLLMAFLIEDLANKNNIAITVHKDDAYKKKQVVINATGDDGTTTNDVKRWKGHITQAPIQNTPSYRAQMAMQLTNLVGSLPPEVQVATLDMVIELMDIPNKQEIIDRVRQVANIPKAQEDMTPEELQAAQAQAQKQQQLEDIQIQELQTALELSKAKVAELSAKVEETKRKVVSADVDDHKTEAEAAKILEEMRQARAATVAAQDSILSGLDQQLASI